MAVDARLLQRLCRRVTPASLRLGEEGARRRTFMVGVERRGRDLLLDLDPVPGGLEGPPRATLDFSVAGRALWLAGSLLARQPSGARLLVTRAPAPRPARCNRAASERRVAFAAFVAPACGPGRRFQPVLDIGMRGMRIESGLPMDAGTLLTDLAVICGDQLIRQGEGVVTNCSTVFYPDGRRVYECSVRLRGRVRAPVDDDSAERIEIDNLPRVKAILWGLCDLEYDVSVLNGGDVVRGRVLQTKDDRSRVPELRCRMDDAGRVPLRSGIVTVECSLFGAGYRFFARVTDRQGDVVTLSPAPKLREWRRRDEERCSVPPGCRALVAFRHPLRRTVRSRRLLDISSHGLGFCPQPEDEDLWPGLPLEDVRVTIDGLSLRVPDADIRSATQIRCGIRMDHLAARDAEALRVRLVELSPQAVTLHDGERLDQVVAFHRSMNLLEPDMEANLAGTFEEARRTWHLGHQRRNGLMRTAIVNWNGAIGATLTSVRAYESTWVLQHSAVASPAVPAGAGQLHAVLMRLAAQRADGEYVAGYIDAGAKALHGMVNTFFAEPMPAHRGATRFMLYSARARPATAPCAPAIRRLRGADELIVEHVGQRLIDPVCARALSLRAGEIELPRTRAAYRRLGIERGREAYGVFDGDRCLAVLLREYASPGLCLSGLMSAGMLFPVLPEHDADGVARRALCELLLGSDVPAAPPYRFLFIPAGADDAPVLSAGFRCIGECTFFALHRFGFLDYQRYVSNKYGLLQARLRSRTGRVPQAA